jgi:DNA-binding PadR family transcriptional regulator
VIPHDEVPLSPLTMAILLALAGGDQHGYALMQEVERQTQGMLKPGTGSLYAALERLTEEGRIESAPDAAPAGPGRPRRTWRITEKGRQSVQAEALRMQRVLEIARERELAPGGRGGLDPAGGEA